MEHILELDRVSKSFPGVRALRDMSFSVRRGEVHAICGENGAGKSTLMKVISGVFPMDSGEILFAGKKVEIANPNEALALGISIMYQETSLFPEMTILDNLFLNHEITKRKFGFLPVLDYAAMAGKVETILASLNSRLNLHTKVKSIGMAQKQLVEIAKALTFDSKVLIMDEPTASLTQREVSALFDVIRDLKGRGVSIVYISHRLEEVFEICDRVTVIRDGSFISCNDVKDTNKERLVADMVGRDLDTFYPKAEVAIGDVFFKAKGISLRGVLHDASLNIRRGEIVGLSGLAGAGRTELALAICGLLRKDSGAIVMDGAGLSIANYRSAMNAGIFYVSEDRSRYGLVLKMNIKQNVALPQIQAISRHMLVDADKETEMGRKAIADFEIRAPSPEFTVENLSGGNQQKVSVAKATALNPKLLILDEPTRGVDVNAKAEIHRLIGRLVERGLSILMISSELPELLGMCDRIYVMKSGEIRKCFDRSDATQEALLRIALDG